MILLLALFFIRSTASTVARELYCDMLAASVLFEMRGRPLQNVCSACYFELSRKSPDCLPNLILRLERVSRLYSDIGLRETNMQLVTYIASATRPRIPVMKLSRVASEAADAFAPRKRSRAQSPLRRSLSLEDVSDILRDWRPPTGLRP